jgi:hypothetical protein
VQASLVAEKELRARITRDAALLAEARSELDRIDDELASLRAERLGDRIAETLGPPRTATDPAAPGAVAGRIGTRLAEAVRRSIEHASEVLGAELQPAPVLGEGDTRAADRPARLVLSRDSLRVLGGDVQSRVVITPGAIRIWLAGLSALEPGDVVVVAALTPDGRLAETRAVLAPGTDRVRLELAWPVRDDPTELALAVVRSGAEP